MKISTLEDLFIFEVCDVLNAERLLLKNLPKMAEATSDYSLAASLCDQLVETEEHVFRLKRILEMHGISEKDENSIAMSGLIEECQSLIKRIEEGAILDAAMITATQKIDHYEISSYGILSELAKQLGYKEAASILEKILDEKKSADQRLMALAQSEINERVQMNAVAA